MIGVRPIRRLRFASYFSGLSLGVFWGSLAFYHFGLDLGLGWFIATQVTVFVVYFVCALIERSAMRRIPELGGELDTHVSRRAATKLLRELLKQGHTLEDAIWLLHHVHGVRVLDLWPVVVDVTGMDRQEAARLVVRVTAILFQLPKNLPLGLSPSSAEDILALEGLRAAADGFRPEAPK
jgi:hypothetical protein